MMLVIESNYSLDVQVASNEWVLAIQIKHFENPYNVEIRNGLYCCCDNPNMTLCSKNITHEDGKCLFDSSPDFQCQPYFLIHVRDCLHNQTCSVVNTYRMTGDSSFALNQLVLHIPVMETESSNEVRIIKNPTKSVVN